MAKTFDEVVYSLLKKEIITHAGGITGIQLGADGNSIDITYGAGGKDNVPYPKQLTSAQRDLVSRFTVDTNGKLLFDGEEISSSSDSYNDAEVKQLIADNTTNIATNTTDIATINTKIGNTTLPTTATDITGAIKEVDGNLLGTVSFSADYKNIVLNRKNGTNPYTIPISAIINHASLIELYDVDDTDIGHGKTLIYDATTQKHKYVSSSGTDEFVKMDSTTDAHYLEDLLDKQTIVNDNGILKVKKIDGQEVTIEEINRLKGLTMNVMDLVNTFASGGVKVINTPLNTASELSTMDRSAFIDGISYIVYVLTDEYHAGAKTTYLVDKTNTTFFGNADSQRNFTTNPIDLASEVTGKLGTSNIDVDSLWTLLTIDDTYKTLTVTNNVFGTHGAKAMYDELIVGIGNKASKDEFDTHIGDTTIHITQYEREKWDKVSDKVDKTNILDTINSSSTNDTIPTAKAVYDVTKNALTKDDVTTTIDSYSTDDTVPTAKAVYGMLKTKQVSFKNTDINWIESQNGMYYAQFKVEGAKKILSATLSDFSGMAKTTYIAANVFADGTVGFTSNSNNPATTIGLMVLYI